jgi:hypothetical protein
MAVWVLGAGRVTDLGVVTLRIDRHDRSRRVDQTS